MKSLTATAAALFLFAATGIAAAQDSTDSGGSGADTTGGASATSNDNPGSGNNNCTDYKAGSGFGQISPKCRSDVDAWSMSQTSASASYDGEMSVGASVPDSYTLVDVPGISDHGYVMLNDRRVLVDRGSRKIVHVYE